MIHGKASKKLRLNGKMINDRAPKWVTMYSAHSDFVGGPAAAFGGCETPSPLLRTLGRSRRKSFILSIHIPCTKGVKAVAVAVKKHLPDSEYGTVFRTPGMSYFRHLQCPILDTRNVLF